MYAGNQRDPHGHTDPHHPLRTTMMVAGLVIGATLGLVGGVAGVAAAGCIGGALGLIGGLLLEHMLRRAAAHDGDLEQAMGIDQELDDARRLQAPAIDAPCPACVEVRRASGDSITWCAYHANPHMHPRLHYAYPPAFSQGWTFLRP